MYKWVDVSGPPLVARSEMHKLSLSKRNDTKKHARTHTLAEGKIEKSCALTPLSSFVAVVFVGSREPVCLCWLPCFVLQSAVFFSASPRTRMLWPFGTPSTPSRPGLGFKSPAPAAAVWRNGARDGGKRLGLNIQRRSQIPPLKWTPWHTSIVRHLIRVWCWIKVAFTRLLRSCGGGVFFLSFLFFRFVGV